MPLSPRISTVASVGATRSAISKTRRPLRFDQPEASEIGNLKEAGVGSAGPSAGRESYRKQRTASVPRGRRHRPARHVDPANIRRVRRDIPTGYEVTTVSDLTAPPGIWGLGGAGTATPPRCAALADPVGGHGQSPQGISGSGAGGTVYAVVVAAPRVTEVLVASLQREESERVKRRRLAAGERSYDLDGLRAVVESA